MMKKTILPAAMAILAVLGSASGAAANILNSSGTSVVPEPHIFGFLAAAMTALAWAGRRRK